MKYTLNEMQIINLADHYTLLYAFLGKSLLEQCGEKLFWIGMNPIFLIMTHI